MIIIIDHCQAKMHMIAAAAEPTVIDSFIKFEIAISIFHLDFRFNSPSKLPLRLSPDQRKTQDVQDYDHIHHILHLPHRSGHRVPY